MATTRNRSPAPKEDARALDRALYGLEAGVYRTLFGAIEACDALAARAEALGLPSQGLRAR